MPRPAKPVRLWIEPARYRPDGAIRNHAAWVILGGGRKVRTGCVGVRCTKAGAISVWSNAEVPHQENTP